MTHDDVDRFIEVDNNPVFIDDRHCRDASPGEFVDDVKNGGRH